MPLKKFGGTPDWLKRQFGGTLCGKTLIPNLEAPLTT
jgi:hypothetical protein